MARGERCQVCGEELSGVARFCAGCGAPVHAAPLPVSSIDDHASSPGTAVVRDRSRWPLIAGVVAVAVFAAALATSRSGESTSGAETTPPTTTAPPVTTAPVEPDTAPPSTTAGTAPRSADVAELPSELADTTLILLTAGRSALALDLGDGVVTPFSIPGRSIRAGDLLIESTAGILVSSPETRRARFLDWSFDELSELPFVSAAEPAADGLWALRPAPINELFRITPEGFPRAVRTFTGAVELTGALDADALVSSSESGIVHRVALDGSTTVVADAVAFGGGQDWLLTFDCDGELRCARQLVDLRSGSTREVPIGDVSTLGRSEDGRRVVLVDEPGGPTLLLDADRLSVTTLGALPTDTEVPIVVDDELRYAFEPRAGVTVTSLDTGQRWRVEVNDIVRRIIVAPDGWEPPGAEG
ncbi:MAG: zinc ribbon domain-containing protein [Actinomycetota bacterium]